MDARENLAQIGEAVEATVAKGTARLRRGAGIGPPDDGPGPEWTAEGVCQFSPPRTLVSTQWIGEGTHARWSQAGHAAEKFADALAEPAQMFYEGGTAYVQHTDGSWRRRPWSARPDTRVSDDPLWPFDVLARALESGNPTSLQASDLLGVTVDVTRRELGINPPDRTIRQRLSPRYRRLDRATPIHVRLGNDGLVRRVSFLYLLEHQPEGWWITTEFLEFEPPVAWPIAEPEHH